MSVENSLPSISFEGLDIKPRDTVRFITNFNEQQRRLTVFIGQLNALAVSIDQEINLSQQAVSDAQQVVIDAINQSQQSALQSIATAISDLQGFLDSVNQSKDLAEEAAGHASAAEQSALNAQAAAAGDLIDDDGISQYMTWSSHEIQQHLTALINALGNKASLASPSLTGSPRAPTQSTSVNDTRLATTAFVRNARATNTLSGGVKVRLNGSNAYFTTNGSNA